MSKYPVFTESADALNAVGLDFSVLNTIQAVDVIQRVPTLEHPNSKNGWIIQFAEGNFLAGNWETGAIAVCSKSADGAQRSKSELQACINLAELHRIRAFREQEKQFSKTANQAKAFWKNCTTAILEPLHPYFERKQVSPVSTIRETNNKILKDVLGLKVSEPRVLVIPLAYQGSIASIQFITESGQKFFLNGGRTGGCYWQTAKMIEPKVVGIAEGVATILSVIQHSTEPMLGVSAMNAGNMPKVAQAIIAKYPNAKINIYGDKDANGVGQKKAKEAQELIGGKTSLFIPKFTETDLLDFRVITESEKAPTDWNDFYMIRDKKGGFYD